MVKTEKCKGKLFPEDLQVQKSPFRQLGTLESNQIQSLLRQNTFSAFLF